MRYVTATTAEAPATPRWGVEEGETVRLAPHGGPGPQSLIEALAAGDPSPAGDWKPVPADACTRLAPIPNPARNVMCLGLNFADHAEESMRASGRELELPEHPVVFTKATGTVTGPGSAVPLDPRVTGQLDWEVEMAVVIGRRGRRIPEERADEVILGYTVVNDLSARDLQFRHKQFFLGKSLDGTCPMGPAIVTPDELGDPHALDLECRVNGAVKQSSNTRHLVFRVPEIIARLSAILTLEPGDIIATGTPAGVGFARQPPEFLQPHDVVESRVEGIGTLRNTVVEE